MGYVPHPKATLTLPLRKRSEQGGNALMWKSVINNGPDPEDEGYDEWVEEVMAEPWVVALEDFIKWNGLWVGTEEQLMLELKTRVGKKVAESEDFPSSFERLLAYQDCAIDGFCQKGFGLLDYRELTEEDLEDFDATGWSEEAPVLVFRDRAAYRPDFWDAQFELLRYWHPFPVAILEFTASKGFQKSSRRWTGTTTQLSKKLAKHYPTYHNIPRIALDAARPKEVDDIDPWPGFATDEEIDAMLDLAGPRGHLVFFKMMKKWRPILQEQRIRITSEKRTVPPGFPERKGEQPKIYWTIEGPRWYKPELWWLDPATRASILGAPKGKRR